MKAEVIAVGSELLTAHHVDTNSLFIAERLNEIGIELQGKSVAADDRLALRTIVSDALNRSNLLILTGGLGPTDDDLTRDVVAELLDRPLEFQEDIFDAIEKRFAARGLRAPAINRRQAMVPRGAVVLPNSRGTAPGLWIESAGRIVVLLPGPPRELNPMLEELIASRLQEAAGSRRLFRRVLRITGQSESYVEEKMHPLYARWLKADIPVSTTILASLGQIELHLSVNVDSRRADEGARTLDAAVEDTHQALGNDLFSSDGRRMPEVIGDLLRSKGLRVSAAESCTGGLVMSRLTEIPGSSDYVDRGVVVYSNQSKVDMLGVPALLIETHGAVSEPVAVAMAEGMARRSGTDLSVGITGVAGPGGGTPDKPVGRVVIAAARKNQSGYQTRVRTFNFVGGREMVRFQASQAALDMLRRWLTEPD